MNTIRVKATDGSDIEFIDEVVGQGAMKDCYFSPDRSYVALIYREKQNAASKERIQTIIDTYGPRIMNGPGGDYLKNLFCWPEKMFEHDGKLGITCSCYPEHFFFEHGSRNDDFLKIKGKEKEGKWFASAKHRAKFIDPRELGNWLSYLQMTIKIARAVKRMHSAGLAHSDLSYKNVLIDPSGGHACIVDIDGLVVPGKFPPDVVGTPDFIAPEVMSTLQLSQDNPQRNLPRIETDRHALSVLIYMYLLYRHPLRGGKIHDQDPQKDEEAAMGAKALFVEDPSDSSNRPSSAEMSAATLPWSDVNRLPYQITGPYLSALFERAFQTGLHNPAERPTADEWEQALVKTVDLVQPCANSNCDQKWYVFDNTTRPKCPFCGTTFHGSLPVLNLYSSRSQGRFLPDNHRLMVYNDQYLYPWHVNRNVFPNEKISEELKRPVAYFKLHGGRWVLVNQSLPGLKDVTNSKEIPIGQMVELTDDLKLLLSPEEGGRLVHVQMAGQGT